MYPDTLFLGLGLYEIMIALGFFAALLSYRVLADKENVPADCQNTVLFSGVAAIILGYIASVFVQALWNSLKTHTAFHIAKDTGATFFGGLLGGAAAFLLVYFTVGHFRLHGYHAAHFFDTANLCAPSIVLAHAFGRLGCLFAGCCYGKPCEAWYCVWNEYLGYTVFPVQLVESLFLFALAAVLIYRRRKGGRYGIPAYMIAYGVFRFFIEYARGDDRGASFFSFLSPSQMIAILLLLGAIPVILLERSDANRKEKAA